MHHEKIFIYQLLPRLFGNKGGANKQHGTLEENGCGKFNDLSNKILRKIKESGYTHVWYIGVLAHASMTDYTAYGIPRQYPEIIKGKAGSPYAIRDYYDVDPDLATNIPKRMQEFENLVGRTQKVGLKVIIDFVPNHVARNYQSISKPGNLVDLGKKMINKLPSHRKTIFTISRATHSAFNSTTTIRGRMPTGKIPPKSQEMIVSPTNPPNMIGMKQ